MTWTTEKPTKPGRYELSIEPGKRAGSFPHYVLVDVANVRIRLSDPWFDGAQWREYQEPADPFAHPVTVTEIELPHDRGSLRIEDDGESVKAIISPSIAGGSATDRLRDLRAAVLSAGEWLTRLCDKE